MKNEDGRPPCERFIPIEINQAMRDARQKQGPNRPSVPLEHQLTLNDLLSCYHYDDEKERLFGIHRADHLPYYVVDELLDTAITEMQDEGVTVVGLVFRIISKVLEFHPVLRKQVLGPVLHHSRSATEVRAEMWCVSRTQARLQKELDGALAGESQGDGGGAEEGSTNVIRLPTSDEK